MTTRRAAVLAYIEAYIARHGSSPGYREIADSCGGMSTSTAARHVAGLEAEGRLRTMRGAARSITLGSSAPLMVALRGVEESIEHGRPSDALRTIRGLLRRLGG